MYFSSAIIETVCCSIPPLKLLSESKKPNLIAPDSAHQHDLWKGFGVNVLDLGWLSWEQFEVLLVGGSCRYLGRTSCASSFTQVAACAHQRCRAQQLHVKDLLLVLHSLGGHREPCPVPGLRGVCRWQWWDKGCAVTRGAWGTHDWFAFREKSCSDF